MDLAPCGDSSDDDEEEEEEQVDTTQHREEAINLLDAYTANTKHHDKLVAGLKKITLPPVDGEETDPVKIRRIVAFDKLVYFVRNAIVLRENKLEVMARLLAQATYVARLLSKRKTKKKTKEEMIGSIEFLISHISDIAFPKANFGSGSGSHLINRPKKVIDEEDDKEKLAQLVEVEKEMVRRQLTQPDMTNKQTAYMESEMNKKAKEVKDAWEERIQLKKEALQKLKEDEKKEQDKIQKRFEDGVKEYIEDCKVNLESVAAGIKSKAVHYRIIDNDTIIRLFVKCFYSMTRFVMRKNPTRAFGATGPEADNLMHPSEIFYDAEACEERLRYYFLKHYYHNNNNTIKTSVSHVRLSFYKYLVDHPGLFTFVAFIYTAFIAQKGVVNEALYLRLLSAVVKGGGGGLYKTTDQFTYSEYEVKLRALLHNAETINRFYREYRQEMHTVEHKPVSTLLLRDAARRSKMKARLNNTTLEETLSSILGVPEMLRHMMDLLCVNHINNYFIPAETYSGEDHGIEHLYALDRKISSQNTGLLEYLAEHPEDDIQVGDKDKDKVAKTQRWRDNMLKSQKVLLTFRMAYVALKKEHPPFVDMMEEYFGSGPSALNRCFYTREESDHIFYQFVASSAIVPYRALESERTSYFHILCDFVFLFLRQHEIPRDDYMPLYYDYQQLKKGGNEKQDGDPAYFNLPLAHSVKKFPEYRKKPRRLVLPSWIKQSLLLDFTTKTKARLSALTTEMPNLFANNEGIILRSVIEASNNRIDSFFSESLERTHRIIASQPLLYDYVERVVYPRLAELIWVHTLKLFRGYVTEALGVVGGDDEISRFSSSDYEALIKLWDGVGRKMMFFNNFPRLSWKAFNSVFALKSRSEEETLFAPVLTQADLNQRAEMISGAFVLCMRDTRYLLTHAVLNPCGERGSVVPPRNVIHQFIEEDVWLQDSSSGITTIRQPFMSHRHDMIHILRSLLYYHFDPQHNGISSLFWSSSGQTATDWLYMNVNHRDVLLHQHNNNNNNRLEPIDFIASNQCVERVLTEFIERYKKELRLSINAEKSVFSFTTIVKAFAIPFRDYFLKRDEDFNSLLVPREEGVPALLYSMYESTQKVLPSFMGLLSLYSYSTVSVTSSEASDQMIPFDVAFLKNKLRQYSSENGNEYLIILRLKEGPIGGGSRTARQIANESPVRNTLIYPNLCIFGETAYIILDNTTAYDNVLLNEKTDFANQLFIISVQKAVHNELIPQLHPTRLEFVNNREHRLSGSIVLLTEKMHLDTNQRLSVHPILDTVSEQRNLAAYDRFIRALPLWSEEEEYSNYVIQKVESVYGENELTHFFVVLQRKNQFCLSEGHVDSIIDSLWYIKKYLPGGGNVANIQQPQPQLMQQKQPALSNVSRKIYKAVVIVENREIFSLTDAERVEFARHFHIEFSAAVTDKKGLLPKSAQEKRVIIRRALVKLLFGNDGTKENTLSVARKQELEKIKEVKLAKSNNKNTVVTEEVYVLKNLENLSAAQTAKMRNLDRRDKEWQEASYALSGIMLDIEHFKEARRLRFADLMILNGAVEATFETPPHFYVDWAFLESRPLIFYDIILAHFGERNPKKVIREIRDYDWSTFDGVLTNVMRKRVRVAYAIPEFAAAEETLLRLYNWIAYHTDDRVAEQLYSDKRIEFETKLAKILATLQTIEAQKQGNHYDGPFVKPNNNNIAFNRLRVKEKLLIAQRNLLQNKIQKARDPLIDDAVDLVTGEDGGTLLDDVDDDIRKLFEPDIDLGFVNNKKKKVAVAVDKVKSNKNNSKKIGILSYVTIVGLRSTYAERHDSARQAHGRSALIMAETMAKLRRDKAEEDAAIIDENEDA